MAIKKGTLVYNNWTGGQWGAKGSLVAGQDDPKQYRAINLQLYSNGSLGPRPGFKVLTTTGTAPAPSSGAAHLLTRWIPYTGTDHGYLLFLANQSAQCARLPLDTLAWASAATGSLNSDWVDGLQEHNPVSISWINTEQVVLGGAIIYDIGSNAAIAISYPSSFDPTRTIFYRDRLYAWGDDVYRNRVYYSDVGAFSTFTAGNYFDVGSGGTTGSTRPRIRGIYPVKDGLLIYTTEHVFRSTAQRYSEGEWFLLQGANPVTGSLRRLGRGRVPSAASLGIPFNDVLVSMDFYAGRGIFSHTGAQLDIRSLAHLRVGYEFPAYGEGRQPIATYGEQSLIFPYILNQNDTVDPTRSGTDPVGYHQEDGIQAYAFVHGVWTKELWWNGAIDYTVTTKTPFVWGTSPFQSDKIIVTTNTSVNGLSGAWRVATRDICLDRPSRTDDTWSDPTEAHPDTALEGSALNCQLWLPAERAADNLGARVRRVTVDFDYWKAAEFRPASTADITCKVRYRGLVNGSADTVEVEAQDGQSGVFDFLPATSGRMSARGRYTFFLPDSAYYGEFQVIFPAIRNCAIHAVTVDVEYDDRSTWQ